MRHAAGDGVAALKRVVAKRHVEAGLRLPLSALQIPLCHGELVQVGEQRVVNGNWHRLSGPFREFVR